MEEEIMAGREAEAAQVHNNAYHSHNASLPARLIYFYYLKRPDDPKEETRVFVLDRGRHIPPHKIQEEIETILGEIHNGDHSPVGWKIGDVRWRHKSWLVFVLDDNQHRLTAGNAVEFSFVDVDGSGRLSENHSFWDGDDTDPFQAYPNISGFYCLNHMIPKGGVGELSSDEQFEVKVHHPHALASGKRTHDDTGTNMGPPVGPP